MSLRKLGALVAIVSASCSSKGSDAPPAAAPVLALYGPAATTKLTPYPSNRYTKPDSTSATGLRVDLRPETTGDSVLMAYPKTMADLDTIDGFSTVGGVYVSFSGEVDPATFTRPLDGYSGADAPAVMIDVDEKSPEKGKTVGLLPLYATTSDGLYDYTSQDDTLVFQPAKPLRPRTKYLFVLTNRVKTRGGDQVQPSADTIALLDGTTKDAYADSVRAALPILEASGTPRASVTLATVFTTETVHDELVAAAKAARATEPPKPSDLTVVEQTDTRVRFKFTYPAPEYRKPKPDGRFEMAGGAPKVQSIAQLETLVAFSDATKSGPRPIVIFGHGLGGDKEGVWGTAERLAALGDKGVAVFGIDAPEHGSRSTVPKDSATLASVFAFFGIDSASKTESFVISRARDNFRQMALDQLELVRLIKELSTLDVLPVGAPDGVPDLDTTKILYLGHSFGSVMGGTIAAIAPEIRAATWNVGGAGLTTLLRDSATFKFIIDALRPAGTPPGDVNRFFATIQAIVDPGDAVNYAKYVTLEGLPGVDGWTARDLLLQEVSGDAIVPNSTSELLARAAGLIHELPARHEVPGLKTAGGPVTGNLPGGATGVFAQFEVGADGKLI
ncbi:MAG: hypothetical protein ACXWUG_21315, partial [Polyangiales bacterium]